MEGHFFVFHFCLAPQFCLGFFSFIRTYWGSFLRREHLLRAVGVGSSFHLLRLATRIGQGYGARVGGPGEP